MAVSCGLSLTWSSPIIPKLNNATRLDENPFGEVITDQQESWIGSLLALGAVFGPFAFGFLADAIGRKYTLLASAVPLFACYLLLAFAEIVELYYVARFIMGLALGGVFTVIMMYIGEVSEVHNRGLLSSAFNCFLVLGLFVTYILGAYLSIKVFNIICAIIPAIFFVVFLLFIPESPAYLISKNKHELAHDNLRKLRVASSKEIENELEVMRQEVEKSREGHLRDLFVNRGLLKALTISVGLVSFQQLSGINVVLFYANTIFEASGSSIPSEVSAIIIGAVQFVSSFITPFIVDRLGRRILFIFSAFGMLISEAVLGVYFYLSKETDTDVDSISWLPVVCLVLYIITYNCGFGPLPWAIMGEIFPSNVRSVASATTSSVCWLLGFILTKFFGQVSDEIGMAGSFWIFAGFCLIAAVFVITYVPETKGKTLAQIHAELGV